MNQRETNGKPAITTDWHSIIGPLADEAYYVEDAAIIFHADCRDILPRLPDKCIDLVLTDPPYGLADKWNGGTWGASSIYADARRWDRDIPTDVVLSLPAIASTSIIWGGNLYTLPPSRSWLAWEKSNRMDTMGDLELAWTNLDQPIKSWKESRNPDGKRKHPTQKPISLMLWCLGFVPFAMIVLDPFLGSGTTAVAAKNLGRRCIGIEIEEKYCRIAIERLKQGVLAL